MMQVTINGEPRQLPPATNAAQLLGLLGLEGQRVALEINREILPRSNFAHYELRPGDHIEIVRAIGGG